MSILRVENKILKYKGISYQISQISSIKIVEIRRNNRKNISLKPLKGYFILLFFCSFLSAILIANDSIYSLISILVACIILFLICKLLLQSIKERFKKQHKILKGLSLRMANGDEPLFLAEDKKLLFNVRDAIYNSINNTPGNSSVTFENVNIEVTDSDKVEIGNIISN